MSALPGDDDVPDDADWASRGRRRRRIGWMIVLAAMLFLIVHGALRRWVWLDSAG